MDRGYRIGRRELLVGWARRAWRGLSAASCMGVLGACAAKRVPEPPAVRVPLAQLPLGQRVFVDDPLHPIELVRSAAGIQARSMLCSHFGCEVTWAEERQQYLCPCHDGVFDAQGQALYGPPTRPLRQFPVTVRDNLVIVAIPES